MSTSPKPKDGEDPDFRTSENGTVRLDAHVVRSAAFRRKLCDESRLKPELRTTGADFAVFPRFRDRDNQFFNLDCRVGQAQRSPTKRFLRFLVGLRKLVPPYIGKLIGPGKVVRADRFSL